MSQFCIYENRNPGSKKMYPYLIDVQTSLLSDLETKIVIPLAKKEKFENSIIKNLNPIITIKSVEYLVLTQQMAGIPSIHIGAEICDCLSSRHEILAAIDFLITGI